MPATIVPAPVRAATRDELIAELYREEGKAEIINGRVVLMSPAGVWHGKASQRITTSLGNYEKAHGGGNAFGDNVGFLADLPDRYSFSPDAAWLAGELPKMKDDYFFDGAPTFAVEVRSTGQYGPSADENILAKIRDYFAAGTQVVWDVDFLRDGWIKKYTPETIDNPKLFKRGDIADAEPAVPGWRFPVDELFA